MAEGATVISEPAQAGAANTAPEKLALVIPTLCEEENIGGLLVHVRSVLDPLNIPYEIVVADDDSRDGTGAVVRAISDQDPRVRLVVRKGERGLSGAILYGWQHTDATILGVMDADLQHPPELLPKLIAAIYEGRDLVIGSRYTQGGGTGSWNPARKLVSAAAVWVTWPIQKRTPCQDSSWCGAAACRKPHFRSPDSSSCSIFWCVATFRRSRKSRLPSACGPKAQARPTSRRPGTTGFCWPGSTLTGWAWEAAFGKANKTIG